MQALVCAALLLLVAVTHVISMGRPQSATPQAREPFAGVLDEHPAIQYAIRPLRDRIAVLNEAVARGSISLAYREPAGYLQSILEALALAPESQLLVFSKTGLQRASTSPRNPRALYFDESVVVGYIPGARFIEIAAHDPEQGVNFYTVDQVVRPAPASATPPAGPTPAIFERRTNCLTCHVAGSTLDVPGMITRSNFTNANGEVIPQLGFHLVDHRTPLAERWGGWFVTGNYVAPPYAGVGHLGNVSTTVHPTRHDVAATSNELLMRWLDEPLEATGYPSHESDIVALMVFDHQMRAINLLTRLNWETRAAIYDDAVDFTGGPLRHLAYDVADYLLFVNEVPPPAQLTPRPGFAEAFAMKGRKDSRGRSLRDFDLERRLMRYPCSFMIYSAAFDHLPSAAKHAVARRMAEILSGQESAPKYARLSAEDRRAISEILRETKPGWPASR